MSDPRWTPNWTEGWDPEVGLWWEEGPGHTVAVRGRTRLHTGRESSLRLVQAAQLGQLDQLEVGRVLAALRALQVTAPGPHRGCFRWYWEETAPQDTNAAFFTILNLLALHLGYREALDEPSGRLVDAMFAEARVWFTAAVAEASMFYPNKYLGDLVCAWLLLEITGGEDEGGALAAAMLDAARYWQETGWGWGEHLSDGYGTVCLRELSLLLLFAQRLPAAVRETYRSLLAELLAIEDAFAAGPRVPALRSYAFSASPTHSNYRDRVRPLATGEAPELEHLFAAHGWHELVGPRAAASVEITIPCFDDTRAVAQCRPDIRLGSVTRFPLMPVAEHDTWGLAWQSFPVCLWRPEGDWGFLQWEVQAGDRVGAHPATGSFHTSYGNAALATGIQPPVFGRTWTIQHGGNLVALRLLPAIQSDWDRVCDRFRLLEGHAEPVESATGPGRQLTLAYPERTVAVACLPLGGAPEIALHRAEDRWDWDLTYAGAALAERRAVVTLWGLSLDGLGEPPLLAPDRAPLAVPRDPEEQAWQVTWSWPGRTWRLRVDPLAPEPLTEW